ncbi:acyl-CoA dehydrogenase family protein [Dactylosporangium sp. NPDC005572]|uniref:acyl-CoA dehydrogenase family protein n=1 Tax=Dactylosporangium sp. NPDC005572 TaxID=3156889 RepID=UPI0033AC12CA
MTAQQADPDLYDLTTAHRELQACAQALADRAAPLAAVADEGDVVEPRIRALLRDSGLCSLMVPHRFGGRYERIDPLAITIVREVLAATSAHLDSLFAMQGIGSYALGLAGHPQVQQHWLPRVGALSAVAALALTEPHVGSDLRAITTQVVVDGDDLVLHGRKSFITNAGDADIYTILAREADGYSAVLVPADTPGLSVEKAYQIIAPHVLGDVLLADVRVPLTHRIGAPGQGLRLMLETLAGFRVSVAGAAVGVAQAALNEAVRHTTSRQQFGAPLADLGAVQSVLAQSWIDIELARSLTYRAAAAAARDPSAALRLSSMAKVAATEVAGHVTDRAVQLAGRFGLVRGSKIERLYREARPMRIYEGATEVILQSLARQLVKGKS